MLQFVKRARLPEEMPVLPGLPKWLCELLVMRGIDSPEKAEAFLHPSLEQLYNPHLIPDMQKAVSILLLAKESGKKVAIYGDYDVDGMCASSIMDETLNDLGIDHMVYIPSRQEEGYGLNKEAVKVLADSCQVLLTVDCGVTNHEEVRLAQKHGMEVIVTDHHQLSATPSPADAVLNPLLGDYPFRRLCGAGVALKLTQALLGMEGVDKRLSLAALATIADVVPLVDENRVIVSRGLEKIPTEERIGIRALMIQAGLLSKNETGKQPASLAPTASQVAFQLAPRLNAGGRLEHAINGVKLLTTTDQQEADRIAAHLEEENTLRRTLEEQMLKEALEQVREHDFINRPCLIVHGKGWNPGVIGLTASRLCEKYYCPVIALSEGEGDLSMGSARSIPGVNIFEMLSKVKDLFLRFGGHEQAAGLTVRTADIDKMDERLNEALLSEIAPETFFPRLEYDVEAGKDELTLQTVDELKLLAPTGFGNPAPVFLLKDAQVQSSRAVGREGAHLQLTLSHEENAYAAIAFRMGQEANRLPPVLDALFTPDANTWKNHTTLQLQIKALCQNAEQWRSNLAKMSEDEFYEAYLQEIVWTNANIVKIQHHAAVCTPDSLDALVATGRGVLLLAHTVETAAAYAQKYAGRVDLCLHTAEDNRCFATLVGMPQIEKITEQWKSIVLLDGEGFSGETDAILEKCPQAKVYALDKSESMGKMVQSLALRGPQLNRVYMVLRAAPKTLETASKLCGLTKPQTVMGLYAFDQLGMCRFTPEPFSVDFLGRKNCKPQDSMLVSTLYAAANIPEEG